MAHTVDRYVVLAGDVAVASAGRAWSAERKLWETISLTGGMRAGSPPPRPLKLRGLDFRATHVSGGIISGLRALLMLLIDPAHPDELSLVLKDGYQSSSKLVCWQGSMPMGAGVQWRIHQGGLIAGDIVSMSVLYE